MRGLFRLGLDVGEAGAGIRLHRCPQVILKIGQICTRPITRSRGLLTGANTASVLARVLVELSFLMALPLMTPFQFDCQMPSSPLSASFELFGCAWSDNLFGFGPTPEAAVSNLSEWAKALHALGSLEIKASSWGAVRASGRKYDTTHI